MNWAKLTFNLIWLIILCSLTRYAFVLIFIDNYSDTFYKKEPFSNFGNFSASNANFNRVIVNSDTAPLLEGVFPTTNNKHVSNNGSEKLWWHYPSFGVGSFEQITNNVKYPNNPDNGTCSPALFCGAMYKDTQEKSNISVPLESVKYGEGARVNYYRNKKYLLQFNNKDNILY